MVRTATKKSVDTRPQKAERNRVRKRSNGKGEGVVHTGAKQIIIPALRVHFLEMNLIGTTPLLVNNKMGIAEAIARQYDKSAGPRKPTETLTKEEQYLYAFYVLPTSKYKPPSPNALYGVPTSGVKKCACSALRTT